MSGVVKAVKKVFKGVGKVVKKIAKPLAIAALAVYTGGLALGAAGLSTGATAIGQGGFFGTLFGAGAQGTNIFSALKMAGKSALQGFSAGSGIFGKVGQALFGGPGTGTSAIAGNAAGSVGMYAPQAAGSELGANWVGNVAGAAAKQGAGQVAGTVAKSAAKKGLFSDITVGQALLAQTGVSALAGLTAPTMDEVNEANKRFRGAYYGSDPGFVPDPTKRIEDSFPKAPRRLFPSPVGAG